MSKIQPISLSEHSLKIRIEDDVYKSESSSSESSLPVSRSCDFNLSQVNESKDYLYVNNRRTSVSNISLNVPYQAHHVRRQVSSSPIKANHFRINSKRRLSQDSGIASNRGFISLYHVSPLHL